MIVATWNVENLFRPGSADGAPDATVYDAKREALAATIDELAPDVLALQEIGSQDALDDLAQAAGGGWETAISTFPDGRGIRVAFLSRLALSEVTDVRDFPNGLAAVQVSDDDTASEMGRGALRVRVELEGAPVDLVTCHFKSKLLTFPGGRFAARDEDERARYGVYALQRRASEAATVRAAATELLDVDGAAVVVLGDLNDEPNAATTQILHGPPGSEIGTGGFGRPDGGDGQRLWNIAPLIPAERRFSRVYRGRRELIDHILLSAPLVRGAADATTITDPASIDDDRGARRRRPASDHAPVSVRLALP